MDAKVAGDAPNFSLKDLTAGAEYYIRVMAVNEAGISKAYEVDAPVAARTPIRECITIGVSEVWPYSSLSLSCLFI